MVLLATTLVFFAIGYRLVSVQGLSADHYLKVGLDQRLTTVKLAGQRGTIFDRDGTELAVSVPQATIWADPQLVADPEHEAARLAPVLNIAASVLQAQLAGTGQFVYLAHTVPDAVASAVTGLKLKGIFTMHEPKRFDPASPLASPLLGVVGTDGHGLSGLEASYNSVLSGRPGTLIQETDPSGTPIPGGFRQYQPSANGTDLVLTIDGPLQAQTEQALASAIVAAKAKSGMAMVMDTQTGELLAVASLASPQPVAAGPGQSPTCPQPSTGATLASTGTTAPTAAVVAAATTAGTGANATVICPPVATASATPFTNVFEPGSMSKVVTISAALQNGVVVPSDRFSVPDTLHVADGVFHDAESHPVENWTVTDILANSSNVGTITLAQRLGAQRLSAALSAFGFGQYSGVNIPGESAGLVPPRSQWSGTSVATIPIGQGVAVTAVQMLAAYNTIANGGVYVAPKLVAGTVGTDGQTRPTPPSAQRRVVSAQVATEMTTMLGEVVRVGTGQSAAINQYAVAGKTGTALVPLPNRRGYMSGVYASSFAGFVPAGHPRLTTIVVIDQTPYFGAMAAAPVFRTIAGDALRDFQVPPAPAVQAAAGVPLATPQTAQAAGETLGPRSAGGVAAGGSTPAASKAASSKPSSGAAATKPNTAAAGTATTKAGSGAGPGGTANTAGTGAAKPATATKPTTSTTVPPARR